mmetsp:Transcript_26527/g.84113  ORF Transcript_26527/g.84113 Transcript_26527/m.84113 type:complete len:205 (+) Transcript_26527:450-1064(+)
MPDQSPAAHGSWRWQVSSPVPASVVSWNTSGRLRRNFEILAATPLMRSLTAGSWPRSETIAMPPRSCREATSCCNSPSCPSAAGTASGTYGVTSRLPATAPGATRLHQSSPFGLCVISKRSVCCPRNFEILAVTPLAFSLIEGSIPKSETDAEPPLACNVAMTCCANRSEATASSTKLPAPGGPVPIRRTTCIILPFALGSSAI